jgi:hypothetical protein
MRSSTLLRYSDIQSVNLRSRRKDAAGTFLTRFVLDHLKKILPKSAGMHTIVLSSERLTLVAKAYLG